LAFYEFTLLDEASENVREDSVSGGCFAGWYLNFIIYITEILFNFTKCWIRFLLLDV
jgi:hypothetical protein